MNQKPAPIYQLKITLRGSKLLIWRRVLVSSETTLSQLHMIIQKAMGWTNNHLHMFRIHDEQYSAPSPYDSFHLSALDAKNTHRVTV